MRRSDRAVTEFDDIIKIMKKCDVCRLALNNDGYPYILPLNFGLLVEGDCVELYFHGAADGTKYDLIKKDNRASFEMDCEHKLRFENDRGYCTMDYESVIGRGHIEFVSEQEKYRALQIIMDQYHDDGFQFNESAMERTCVFKLVVENMIGKIKPGRKSQLL